MITENIDFMIIEHATPSRGFTLQVIHSCGHPGSFMYDDEQVAKADAEHMKNIPCVMCDIAIHKKAS